MGSGNLPDRADGNRMDAPWWNAFQDALKGDVVPRDSSAVAANLSATLGESAFRWRRLNVASGHFSAGNIKEHYSYNGLVPITQGWMLCDGRQITQDNYDLEHGAGSWATHIVSSLLENRFLPNMVGKFAVGVSETAQDGTEPITSIGNVGNEMINSHVHQVIPPSVPGDNNDNIYDIDGSLVTLQIIKSKNNSGAVGLLAGGSAYSANPPGQMFTKPQAATPYSIKPLALDVLYYMRVI